jgi:hypothetical protein
MHSEISYAALSLLTIYVDMQRRIRYAIVGGNRQPKSSCKQALDVSQIRNGHVLSLGLAHAHQH